MESRIADVICTYDKNSVTIRNDYTTLRIDNNLRFEILNLKNGNLTPLTEKNETDPSIYVCDSLNKKILFARKSVQIEEINDRFGQGENVRIEALSVDGRIKCRISLNSYGIWPNVFLVQSTFFNISEMNYFILYYSLSRVLLHSSSNESKWWTFQGTSHRGGIDDFTFQLPGSFSSENYMGYTNYSNDLKGNPQKGGRGGGIPLADIWNKEFGLALACLDDKPVDVSLPVKVENGKVSMGISENAMNKMLKSGDSLVSTQTAIIVHKNDFYDAVRTYSGLIKTILPDFKKAPDLAYLPEVCTWGYDQNINPGHMLSRLESLKSMGVKSVIIDDGWSVYHGDWTPDPKIFPNGEEDFKGFINKIHEAGLKVWLWWVPGYIDSKSPFMKLHTDWFIKNKDGSIHSSYGLCPAYKPVQQYYTKLVQKFVEEYNLDGFKEDLSMINSAPPCYNPDHNHKDPFESFYSTPMLFRNIYQTALQYNPEMVIEYCSCGIPPAVSHLPWTNLMVTSDPFIQQITSRIKLYKALMGDDFPVLEEYCGVLAGPVYELAIGAGGVPGTFSTYMDIYHEKWLNIYSKYQLSRGEYMNLYDIGFDYPEAHVIKKDGKFYFAFYTHPWTQLENPLALLWRFGEEHDITLEGKTKVELPFPKESYAGKVDFRGLDKRVKYRIFDYVNNKDFGIINGDNPVLEVSFVDYLLLELSPVSTPNLNPITISQTSQSVLPAKPAISQAGKSGITVLINSACARK